MVPSPALRQQDQQRAAGNGGSDHVCGKLLQQERVPFSQCAIIGRQTMLSLPLES
jgi:hypothetical protein